MADHWVPHTEAPCGMAVRQVSPDGNEPLPVQMIAYAQLLPNPYQPRERFDGEALAELAASMSDHGVLHPLVVRPLDEGRYQIVIGERRWRAAQLAGLPAVPCIVRPTTDAEMGELALVENVQRYDLSAVEEGLAYCRLMEREGLSLRQAAARVRRSHEHVARRLRIVADPQIAEAVRGGALGATLAAELGRAEHETIRPLILARLARGLPVTPADLAALSSPPGDARPEPGIAEDASGTWTRRPPLQLQPLTEGEISAEDDVATRPAGPEQNHRLDARDRTDRLPAAPGSATLSEAAARALVLRILRADLAWLEAHAPHATP